MKCPECGKETDYKYVIRKRVGLYHTIPLYCYKCENCGRYWEVRY